MDQTRNITVQVTSNNLQSWKITVTQFLDMAWQYPTYYYKCWPRFVSDLFFIYILKNIIQLVMRTGRKLVKIISFHWQIIKNLIYDWFCICCVSVYLIASDLQEILWANKTWAIHNSKDIIWLLAYYVLKNASYIIQ